MKTVVMPYRDANKLVAYAKAVRAAGLTPITVPACKAASLDGATGLVLLGGTDVNPRLYGEVPRPETEEPDDDRDAMELELIAEATNKGLPILAICRGLQILNVARGGTLIQHLPSVKGHDPDVTDKAAGVHHVTFEPETILASIAGAPQWHVNSRHHQAAGRIGTGLKVSARAEDGTIEGLEGTNGPFVVAVQWHPEDQVLQNCEQQRLFNRFAEAC